MIRSLLDRSDRLSAGSGTEEAFIALARNEDVFFKLGWHVVKNRKFEESHFSIEERNDAEARFFRTSNFQVLPSDCYWSLRFTGRYESTFNPAVPESCIDHSFCISGTAETMDEPTSTLYQ
jgi:hypothetical protein